MRRAAASTMTLLILSVSTLLGQQGNNGTGSGLDPSKYWQSPGETDRDSKGNITYTEVKDPKTFTTRVFTHGQWVTYHYRPGTTDVLSIDTPDSTEELLYDASRKFNGITVHAGGKSHTLHYDRDHGVVTTDGMPSVVVEQDPSSTATRDLRVRRGSEIVASVSYAPSGEVRALSVGPMTISFTLTGNGVKETLQANAATIKEAHATSTVNRTFRVLLDPVADRLHIGKTWATDLRSSTTPTGYLTTMQQGNSVVARLVEVGGMQVAFDSTGAPLFYDVLINYGPQDGGDRQKNNYKTTAAYAAALPTHIIITADGNVGAYVETPGNGAIRAFWTTSTDGHTTYNYSIYDSGSSKPVAAFGTEETSAPSQPARISWSSRNRIVPTMRMMCDSSTVCSYSDGCPSCGGCSTTYYYCDYDGTGPPPDEGGGSGGSGGGNSPGNHVYGITLHAAVDRAISAANNKLSDPQCSVQMLKNATWDGTSAWDVLQSRGGGESTAQWFAGISWIYGEGKRDGNNQIPCQTSAAWTTPGSTTDYVCDAFQNVRFPANLLLHEMLHTIGMPECNGLSCPNSTYKTPQQIDALVADSCGAN